MARTHYSAEAANKIYDGFCKSGLTQTEYSKQINIPKSSLSSLCVSVRRARAIMVEAARVQAEKAAVKAEKLRAVPTQLPLPPAPRAEASSEGSILEALMRENAALKRMLASNWGYSHAG